MTDGFRDSGRSKIKKEAQSWDQFASSVLQKPRSYPTSCCFHSDTTPCCLRFPNPVLNCLVPSGPESEVLLLKGTKNDLVLPCEPWHHQTSQRSLRWSKLHFPLKMTNYLFDLDLDWIQDTYWCDIRDQISPVEKTGRGGPKSLIWQYIFHLFTAN